MRRQKKAQPTPQGQFNSDLGQYLRNERLRNDISQVTLAKILGYTPQFIANWERGASSPPANAFPKLIMALKINPVDFLKFLTDLSRNYWSRILKAG